MKKAITTVAAFMFVFLIGCSEQSPVSVPQSTGSLQSPTQLGKGGSEMAIDNIVIGSTGIKYHVTGAIAYKFGLNGDIYLFETSVNLEINQSGTENTWTAVGGKGFSALNQNQEGAVSEGVGFQYGKFGTPSHRLWIDYNVTPSGVTLSTLRIEDVLGMTSTLD